MGFAYAAIAAEPPVDHDGWPPDWPDGWLFPPPAYPPGWRCQDVPGVVRAAMTMLAESRTTLSRLGACTSNMSVGGVAAGQGVLLAAGASSMGVAGVAVSELAVRYAVADTQLAQSWPDTNYGTGIYLGAGRHYSFGYGFLTGRSLISFDVSDLAGKTITSATMKLFVNTITKPVTARTARVLRQWLEGEATWNSARTGVAWSTAGADGAGDRTDFILSGYSVGGSGSQVVSAYCNFDVTQWVQDWVSGSSNYGLLLSVTQDAEDTESNLPAWSRSYSSGIYAPTLTVATSD